MRGKMSVTQSIIYKILSSRESYTISDDSVHFALIWEQCCKLTGHKYYSHTISENLNKLIKDGKVERTERGWYKVIGVNDA